MGSSPTGEDNSNLAKSVTAVVNSIGENLNEKDVKRLEKYIAAYPKFLYRLVSENRLKLASESKKEKLSQLESILSGKSDDTEKERLLTFLEDKSYRNYKIDIFKPGVHDYKKIRKFATSVGMCWEGSERKYLSQMVEEDARLYGGTIMYSISRTLRTTAVVRDFIGRDSKGRTYLFVDSIEGWDKPNYSHHEITTWESKDFGTLKLAILTSLYIADKIGVDYVALGDTSAIDCLKGTGFSKVRTAVNEYNRKIGYPADESPQESEKKVKSYFFHDKKNYCIYLKVK